MKFDLAWPILLFILGFLGYAAYVIKNEKSWAKVNEKTYELGGVLFNTPSWWSVLESKENFFKFYRQDTRYDWNATCQLLTPTHGDLKQIIIEKINSQSIFFDQEQTDITEEENSVRIEGTATKEDEDRLYLDVFVYRDEQKNLYYFENRSSILNGCVEGPYFDELVKSIRESKN